MLLSSFINEVLFNGSIESSRGLIVFELDVYPTRVVQHRLFWLPVIAVPNICITICVNICIN